MVVDALQLKADGAKRFGAGGGFHAGGAFYGVTKRGGVRETGVAGNVLRQAHPMRHGNIFEEFFGAFMRIEQAELEIENGFARNAEEEMAGLDDSGMDGTDRHQENALRLRPRGNYDAARKMEAEPCADQNLCGEGYTSGQSSCSAQRRGFGWPTSFRPNRSWISRSCQFAAGMALDSEMSSGRPGKPGRAR